MAVRIISESERGTFEYGEGKFQFRRAPLHKVKQWERAHYNKREGKPDYYAVSVEATKYCIRGWDEGSVTDGYNKPIAWSEGWMDENADKFPQDFYAILGDHVGISNINTEKKEKEVKNSAST